MHYFFATDVDVRETSAGKGLRVCVPELATAANTVIQPSALLQGYGCRRLPLCLITFCCRECDAKGKGVSVREMGIEGEYW